MPATSPEGVPCAAWTFPHPNRLFRDSSPHAHKELCLLDHNASPIFVICPGSRRGSGHHHTSQNNSHLVIFFKHRPAGKRLKEKKNSQNRAVPGNVSRWFGGAIWKEKEKSWQRLSKENSRQRCEEEKSGIGRHIYKVHGNDLDLPCKDQQVRCATSTGLLSRDGVFRSKGMARHTAGSPMKALSALHSSNKVSRPFFKDLRLSRELRVRVRRVYRRAVADGVRQRYQPSRQSHPTRLQGWHNRIFWTKLG